MRLYELKRTESNIAIIRARKKAKTVIDQLMKECIAYAKKYPEKITMASLHNKWPIDHPIILARKLINDRVEAKHKELKNAY